MGNRKVIVTFLALTVHEITLLTIKSHLYYQILVVFQFSPLTLSSYTCANDGNTSSPQNSIPGFLKLHPRLHIVVCLCSDSISNRTTGVTN